MTEVACPYCDAIGEIQTDLGMEENLVYQGRCPFCNKLFAYQAVITIQLDVRKADCLNGGNHRWWRWMHLPTELLQETRYCLDCGEVEKRRMENREIPMISKRG